MTKRTREIDGRLAAGLERLREVPARDPKLVEKGLRLFLLEAKAVRGNLPAPLVTRLTKWIDEYLPKEVVILNWKFASLTALVVIATVVTLLFGTAVATAYASRGALPGDALYSVKTGMERAQLTLSSDTGRETRLHLTFAEKRLDELTSVTERGRTEAAASLVEQFEAHIGAAIESLGAKAASDPLEAQALTAAVMEALSRYSQILGELYAIVPDVVQPAVAKAIEASQPGSHLPEVDLPGTVVSIGDSDPESGEAIWEIELSDGSGVVSVIVTEQTFVADGVEVGDLVKMEAFVVEDTLVADEIYPAEDQEGDNENDNANQNENENTVDLDSRVKFTGAVEAIGADTWTVSGRVVTITDTTEIKGDLKVGDLVRIEAILEADGTLTAVEIKPSDDGNLKFTGVVESIGTDAWTIGGFIFTITDTTEIKGDPQIGELVRVSAMLEADGTLTALEIKRADKDRVRFTGVVETIGANAWTISGRAIAVAGETKIKGDPQVGDLVKVDAILEEDGSLTAIEIKRTEDDRFTFTGVVESIATESWMIGGWLFAVTGETEIIDDPQVGNLVKVKAVVREDGSLTATQIRRSDADFFKFTGVVESIGADSWTIGGRIVVVTSETEIKGDPRVGDLVKVKAILSTDGVLIAVKIESAEDIKVKYTGVVESINVDSWTIGGRIVVVTSETKIKGDPQVGDLVKVDAILTEDGSLIATKIKLAKEQRGGGGGKDKGEKVRFTGVLESMEVDTWMIGGQMVAVTEETKIIGNLEVGDHVKVDARLFEDGSLIAREIKLAQEDRGGGNESGQKIKFSGVVKSIGADAWTIGGRIVVVTSDTNIKGDVQVGDPVTVDAIFTEDGSLIAKKINLEKDKGKNKD